MRFSPPLAALGIFLIPLPFLFLAPPARGAARGREVTTFGSCVREVQTDRGAIVLTADFVDPDLATAVRKATEAYDHTLAAIQKLGLAGLETRTVEYTVNEDKEWQGNKAVSKGYRARIGLRVSTSDIPKLGAVVGIATREKVRDVSGLTTFLSDEKLRHEQELCLKKAGEQARNRARELASSVGATLGEVLSLTENTAPGAPPFQPMPRIRASAFGDSKLMNDLRETPSVQSGEEKVRVRIEAVFALK